MKKLLLLVLSILYIGCGSNETNTYEDKIIGYVIDSPVWGLDYTCADETKATDKDGKFECSSLPVTFYVGDLTLGTISKLPLDNRVYPQDMVNIPRSDIENPKVLKLAQLLQSLDDDGDIDEAIKIENSLKTKLKLDEKVKFQDINETKLVDILDKGDISLIAEIDAKNHLKTNIVKNKKPYKISISTKKDKLITNGSLQITVKGFFDIEGKDVVSILTKNINYTSSDNDIATISPNGKITAQKEGNVKITVKYDDLTASKDIHIFNELLKDIKITKPTQAEISNLALKKINSLKLSVTGYYYSSEEDEDIVKEITNQVIWSSNSSVISNLNHDSGFFEADGNGKASITATVNGVEDTIHFEIKEYTPESIIFDIRDNRGSKKDFSNEISIPVGSILRVNLDFSGGANIIFTDLPGGINLITQDNEIETKSLQINLNDYQIAAVGKYKDGSYQYLDSNWTTAEEIGLIKEETNSNFYIKYKAKEQNRVSLIAKYNNISATLKVNITEPITRQIEAHSNLKNNILVNEEIDYQLSVSKYLSDDTKVDITDQVKVENLTPDYISLENGKIKMLKSGIAEIKISYIDKHKQEHTLTQKFYIGYITNFAYVGINGNFLLLNDTQPLIAYGQLSNRYTSTVTAKLRVYLATESDIDITNYVTWQSLDETIATISDGNIIAQKRGTAKIKAIYKNGSRSLETIVNIPIY